MQNNDTAYLNCNTFQEAQNTYRSFINYGKCQSVTIKNLEICMQHVVIRNAGKFVDVFHGQNGWEESGWTRFLPVKGNDGSTFLKFIKGASVEATTFNWLKDKFNGTASR